MYLRIWQYEVRPEAVDRFVTAYGADGDWARLFARGEGFLGTELFRGTDAYNHFITVDSWHDRSHWHAFLRQWGDAYQALDATMDPLTAVELALFEGAADSRTHDES